MSAASVLGGSSFSGRRRQSFQFCSISFFHLPANSVSLRHFDLLSLVAFLFSLNYKVLHSQSPSAPVEKSKSEKCWLLIKARFK